MEAVLLLMVGAAPWLFGSVHPLAEFLLSGGLCILALLWIIRIVAERHAVWHLCSVTLVLAMLCGLTMAQIVPLPRSWLAVLAPGNADLRKELIPERPEDFPSAVGIPREFPETATISLAPWSTRHMLIQLVAALFVFSLVRSNFSSPDTFYRLAIAAVVNGVALSVIGLAQFVSSKPNVLFWTFVSDGGVFGPFICRNHFAYYINMSMGLGIGLLLRGRYFQADAGSKESLVTVPNMLQDPWVMWIGSALIVMAAGLCCSLSRGGLAAFVIGAAVCLAMHWRGAGKFTHWSVGVVFVGLGLAVTAWLGAGTVGKRVATVWETNILEEGRGHVWSRAMAMFPNSPWVGTGMGTFRFVEPLTRGPTDSQTTIYEHMHNDFLEVLLEGGIIQLALVLTLAFLIFRVGFQAFQRHQGTGLGSMVIGAIFGLVAVAVHSTVDFGLHVPAVTLLAVMIVACLSNLAEPSARIGEETAPPPALGWFTAIAQASVILVIAIFMLDFAWRSERAERYRLAANAMTANQLDKKIAYLEAAVAYTPDDPLMQAAAADAYRERQYQAHQQRELCLNLSILAVVNGTPPFANTASAWLASTAPASLIPSVTEDAVKSFEHYFLARSQCPCVVQPHLFMAAYRDACRPDAEGKICADPAEEYLRRACKLDPSNSNTWYVAGRMLLQKGKRDQAWESWQKSLECDRSHLDDILLAAMPLLSAERLIDLVMPKDPEVVYQAFLYLDKEKKKKKDFSTNTEMELDADQEVYLRQALVLLGRTPINLGSQWMLRARVQARLKQNDAALDSFRQALQLDYQRGDWRLEYSEFLASIGKLAEAHRELDALRLQIGLNERAQKVYNEVADKIAAENP